MRKRHQKDTKGSSRLGHYSRLGKKEASLPIKRSKLIPPKPHSIKHGLLFSPLLPVAGRPVSKEEPVPLDIHSEELCTEAHLLAKYHETFRLPKKVDILAYTNQQLEALVDEVCVLQGQPLVVQNLHKTPKFDKSLFSMTWLQSHLASKRVQVRDLRTCLDTKLPFDEFMKLSQKQAFVRYYGKDLDCPEEWKGAPFIPPFLQPLGFNDINTLLEPQTRIQTLMIYVGYGGTYTPAHFDTCASVGHNILLHADEGNPNHYISSVGCSALWFMVGRDDANRARRFWYKHGGGNTSIDQDNCILPASVIGTAKFPVYLFEQHKGDLVIVPSESAHQVMNLGKGCTIKYAWNRTTPRSLYQAVFSALPVNRRILKPEVFRTKAMVEQAFLQRGKDIVLDRFDLLGPLQMDKFCQEYHILILAYAEIVYNDYAPYCDIAVARDPHPYQRKCDFCQADIWNIWFHCAFCYTGKVQGHDLCIDCVAVNRGCGNSHHFSLMCHRPIVECLRDLTHFSAVYNNSPHLNKLPSFSKVPSYSIDGYENPNPCLDTPLIIALAVINKTKSGEKGVCHQCNTLLPLKDVSTCRKCARHICHTCLAYCYAIDPYHSPRLSKSCLVCLKRCNCKGCYRNSDFKPHPVAKSRFIQTDYYRNYLLSSPLIYMPVGESSALEANVIDYATFLDQTTPIHATKSLVRKPPSKLTS